MTQLIIIGIIFGIVLLYQVGKHLLLNRETKQTTLQKWFNSNNLFLVDRLDSKVSEMFELLNTTYNSHLNNILAFQKSKTILNGLHLDFIKTVKQLKELKTNKQTKSADEILGVFKQLILDNLVTHKGDKDQIITTSVIPLEMLIKIGLDAKGLGDNELNNKVEQTVKETNEEINNILKT